MSDRREFVALGFSPKEEALFLIAELRTAQGQCATLIAAAVAVVVLPGGYHPPKVTWWEAIAAVVAFVTIVSYFINSLRIAGVRVRFAEGNEDGVYVSLRWLRMLTRRAYLARTFFGVALLAAVGWIIVRMIL